MQLYFRVHKHVRTFVSSAEDAESRYAAARPNLATVMSGCLDGTKVKRAEGDQQP
jgi:hypothetical protein